MSKERVWEIYGDPETGEVDPGELAESLQDIHSLIRRMGGVVVIGARRDKIENLLGEEQWVTWGVQFRWAYAPASERPKPSEEPDPEPEEQPEERPVPVEA